MSGFDEVVAPYVRVHGHIQQVICRGYREGGGEVEVGIGGSRYSGGGGSGSRYTLEVGIRK